MSRRGVKGGWKSNGREGRGESIVVVVVMGRREEDGCLRWFAEGGLPHCFLPPCDWPARRILRAARETRSVRLSRLHPSSPIVLPLVALPSTPTTPQPSSISIASEILSSSFSVTMFRAAVVRSLRASVPRAVRAPAAFQIRSSPVARPAQFAPRFAFQAVRSYSAPAGLNKEEVEGRIVNLLKNFDKVRRFACLGGLTEGNRIFHGEHRERARWLTECECD